MTEEELFGSSSAECGAYFVEECLLGHYLAFFGQVPSCAEGFAARHYGDFYERIGVFEVPRNSGVTGFMDCDCTFFFVGQDFGAFFQSSDYAVNGIDEVLAFNHLFVVASCNEGGFVANVGDVCSGKSGRLSSQKVNVEFRFNFFVA